MQRAVLKLAFADNLQYDRQTGFRTPRTTLPFKVLGGFSGRKGEMVPLEGESLNPRGFADCLAIHCRLPTSLVISRFLAKARWCGRGELVLAPNYLYISASCARLNMKNVAAECSTFKRPNASLPI